MKSRPPEEFLISRRHEHGLLFVPEGLPDTAVAGEGLALAPKPALWKRLLRSLLRIVMALVLIVSLGTLVLLGYDELQNSTLQSRWLTDFAASIVYRVGEGPAARALPADRGPYDIRLGYATLPQMHERLQADGFQPSAPGPR